MEDQDQRHKGRETFFAFLLAGLNRVGTSAVLAVLGQKEPLVFVLSVLVAVMHASLTPLPPFWLLVAAPL